MRKIEICISEEQYQKIKNEIEKSSKLNIEHETFSGFQMIITDLIAGISNLEIQMYNKVDIGDVSWKFSDE